MMQNPKILLQFFFIFFSEYRLYVDIARVVVCKIFFFKTRFVCTLVI